MCKQKINVTVKYGLINTQHQQSGFSLVMVMMVMVVIALLVIAGAQVSNTEMRISTNNADQKFAKGLAEKALLEAEKEVTAKVFGTTGTSSATTKIETVDETVLKTSFPDGTCVAASGFCGIGPITAANNLPVWESPVFASNGKEVDISGGAEKPRYIVEYLGIKDNVDGSANIRVFRVTARAVGVNPNTVSTLQTVLVAPSP